MQFIIQLLKVIIPTFRELYFDSQSEADFNSSKFNIYRWLTFIFSIIIYILLLFFIARSILLTFENIELKEKLLDTEVRLNISEALCAKSSNLSTSDSENNREMIP